MAAMGKSAATAWKHIHAASYGMAAKYGVPNIDLRGTGIEDCVQRSLAQMIDHFQSIMDGMLRFDREERKQRFREGLHERGGINKQVGQEHDH